MASKLDPYRDDILRMRGAGTQLSEIIDHLAREYGCLVSLGTLSKFLSKEASADPAVTPEHPIPPELEHHIEQATVIAEIRATVREGHAMTGHMVESNKALTMQTLDHQQAVMAKLEALLAASRTDRDASFQLLAELQELRTALTNRPAPDTPAPPAVTPDGLPLRRIWWRALWITGLFWLLLAVALWFVLDLYGIAPPL